MNLKSSIILEKDFANMICNFAKDKEHLFKINGYGRKYYSTLNFDEEINNYLKATRQLCLKTLDIDQFEEEPCFGIFIGINTESGSVHEHIDLAKDGYVHFRLNFLVSKPEDGGIPIVNGELIKVEELESWINCASKWPHKSTPVVGKKPRIVLSLGALITEQQAEKVIKQCNMC